MVLDVLKFKHLFYESKYRQMLLQNSDEAGNFLSNVTAR